VFDIESLIINELIKLNNRRTYQKLVYTLNIINGLAPDNLSSIYPNAVSNRLHYPLRNALDRDIMARRTEIFATSFIPSSVTLWIIICLQIYTFANVQCF